VIEVVKEKFFDEFEAKLRTLCNPEDLAYIIFNHTEPDHASGLQKLLKIAPNAKVLASTAGLRFLKDQLGHEFESQVISEKDEIDLGNKTIKVISAPNLHWPDSIFTYLAEDKILFTCDCFGAHFAHDAMYNDQVGDYTDALKYYFDVILKPFSKFFIQAIEKIRPLDIQAICTGHGPILTTNWKKIVDLSEAWCHDYLQNYPQKNRIFMPYVSAYGFTKTLAEQIAVGIREVSEVELDLCDIEEMDLNELSERIAKANAYLFGSPTINQNMLLQLYRCFALISPLRDKDKQASCFGSYGWSGETEKILIANIQTSKLDFMGESLFIKFRPHEEDFERFKAFGKKFALLLVSKIK
jgi:flavorubredoxin